MIGEEQIDFAKSAVFGLWQPEPAPKIAEEVSAGIEERGFGSPVPSFTKENYWSARVREKAAGKA